MSRGIGRAQLAILAALEATDRLCLTVSELSDFTGRRDRQLRRAVHSLQRRGRVCVTHEVIGWKGDGQYGNPAGPWKHLGPFQYREDETPRGMPVPGLAVWLPDRHAAREARLGFPHDCTVIAPAPELASDQAAPRLSPRRRPLAIPRRALVPTLSRAYATRINAITDAQSIGVMPYT